MSFPFIIEQVEAPRRAIILQGRSLPYRNVAWGGTQRLDVSWFPGNPVAVVQVIGPTEKPTSITGMWKDIFLLDPENSAQLANFPGLSPTVAAGGFERGGNTFLSAGSIPDQRAFRARIIRDAIRLLRREGGLVKVEWGSIARFGFISETNFPHLREEDIEYEIQFTWVGDTAAQPIPTQPDLDALGLLKKLLALLDEVINTLLGAAFAQELFVLRVTQFIARISSAVTTVLAALEDIAEGRLGAGPALILTIKANLQAIVLEARALFESLDSNLPSAAVLAADTGEADQVSLNAELESNLRLQVALLAAEAARDQARIDENLTIELLDTFIAQANVTLRDVATRFYGAPDNWPAIAAFNGFSGSIVGRGTEVRVPRL
jgi:hypothetical protein